MMIIFRADANSTIGSGHVMRCLSIADAASSKHIKSCFVTADESFSNIIKKRGYENIVLNTNYSEMESELDAFQKILERKEHDQEKQETQEKQKKQNSQDSQDIQAVIVDSYYVTKTYLDKLHSLLPDNTKLVYIDDLSKFAYPVDVLINYRFKTKIEDYREIYGEEKLPNIFLGLEYAPLRKEFQELPLKEPADNVMNILVTAGGADTEHVALKLIKNLKNKNFNYQFHFVIGSLNVDKEEIITLSQSIPCISIHENVQNMHELMSQCDIAISAGGSTILELCASSLPIIAYTVADNQKNVKMLAENGFTLYVGDVRINKVFVEDIFSQLNNLSNNLTLRQLLAEKVHSLVDGKGSERIIQEILYKRYRFKDYSMRPIEESDLHMILKWRNSDRIRKFMLNDHEITWDEHYNWFKRIEQSPIKRYFIFEYQNRPIGYIAYNDYDDENKICSTGMYIGEKRNIPSNAGIMLPYIMRKYAFEEMGILKIKSEIFAYNKKALAISKFLGTREIGEYYRDMHGKKELVKQFEITNEMWKKDFQ